MRPGLRRLAVWAVLCGPALVASAIRDGLSIPLVVISLLSLAVAWLLRGFFREPARWGVGAR